MIAFLNGLARLRFGLVMFVLGIGVMIFCALFLYAIIFG